MARRKPEWMPVRKYQDIYEGLRYTMIVEEPYDWYKSQKNGRMKKQQRRKRAKSKP